MNCSKNKIGVTESATRMRTSARALPEFDLLNVCTKHDLGNKVCEFRDTLVGNVSSYMKEKKSFPYILLKSEQTAWQSDNHHSAYNRSIKRTV